MGAMFLSWTRTHRAHGALLPESRGTLCRGFRPGGYAASAISPDSATAARNSFPQRARS